MPRWVRLPAFDIFYLAIGLVSSRGAGSGWLRRFEAWRYRRLAATYDSRFMASSPDYGAALEAVLRRLPQRFGRILDVGTGTGAAALVVARRFPDALVCGCDLSHAMLRVARARGARFGSRIGWHQADGARLPYPDASFDLVLLQNAPPALGELVRVVRSGGTVALCHTKGGAFPRFLQRSLVRRLDALGALVVDLGRVGSGLYVIARRR